MCRTTVMAKDAIAIMDHLGWKKAHVVGHSMGEYVTESISPTLLTPSLVIRLRLLTMFSPIYSSDFTCEKKIDCFSNLKSNCRPTNVMIFLGSIVSQ